MAVSLNVLLEKVQDIEMKLVAGNKGIDSIVRCVHMVEDVQISSFLEGEEVAFTTGIGIKKQEDLLALVKNVHMKNAIFCHEQQELYTQPLSEKTFRPD